MLPAPYNLEPGGLDWWRLLDVLRGILATRRVVSMDLSGHRGSGGRVMVDFTLSKLLYKAAGYRLCPREAGIGR